MSGRASTSSIHQPPIRSVDVKRVLRSVERTISKQNSSNISLPSAGLDDEIACNELGELLSAVNKAGKTLTVLNLSDNSISSDGINGVRNELQLVSILVQAVDLSFNLIGSRGAGTVAEALVRLDPDNSGSTSQVAVLKLTGNSFRDLGAQAIAEALSPACLLRELYLGGNDIGPEGARALAGVLFGACRGRLQVLELRGNPIKDAGAIAIAEAISSSSSSSSPSSSSTTTSGLSLGLAKCSIEGKGIIALLEALRDHDKDGHLVSFLDLWGNVVSSKPAPKVEGGQSETLRIQRLLGGALSDRNIRQPEILHCPDHNQQMGFPASLSSASSAGSSPRKRPSSAPSGGNDNNSAGGFTSLMRSIEKYAAIKRRERRGEAVHAPIVKEPEQDKKKKPRAKMTAEERKEARSRLERSIRTFEKKHEAEIIKFEELSLTKNAQWEERLKNHDSYIKKRNQVVAQLGTAGQGFAPLGF
jgi:hypothetical protein